MTGNSAVGANGSAGNDGSNNGGSGSSGGVGAPISGGAIFNLGFVRVDSCRFITNTATGGTGGPGGDGGTSDTRGGNGGAGGAGALGYGGAIYNGNTLIVTNSTFTGNAAIGGNGGDGGAGGTGLEPGMNGNGGAAALAGGGAIYNAQTTPVSAMLVSSSTFSGNTAKGGSARAAGTSAGGVGNTGKNGGVASGGAILSAGSVNATNCTFSANSALGGGGGDGGPGDFSGGDGGNGGLAIGGGICSSNIIITMNVTLSANTAKGGTNGVTGASPFPGSKGSVGASRGGNIANGLGNFFLENTILNAAPSGSNAFGTCTDLGNNLSSDSTPTLGASSKKNTNPLLFGLADNGGPQTMAINPNSPARNAGNNSGAPAFDERGLHRDSIVDIGAYEIAPPYILSGPTNLVVTNGQTAVFTVFASGLAPLKYQWRFNGANILSATNSSLTITNVQSTNAGNYNVVVSDTAGSTTSAVATLTVRVAPIFLTQPTNVLAATNSDATFTAQVTGDPPIFYQWRFNTTNLVGETNNTLILHSVQATNVGTYSLVATNIYGSNVSSGATLKLTSAPTMSASAGTNKTLVLSIPVQTGFTYVVEAKTNLTDPTWLPQVTNKPTTNGVITFSSTTTNPPSRFYRVRVQ